MTNRRLTAIGIALTLLLALSGCGSLDKNGSGQAETTSFALDDFDAIEIGETFQLIATASDTYSIEINVDDNHRFEARQGRISPCGEKQ